MKSSLPTRGVALAILWSLVNCEVLDDFSILKSAGLPSNVQDECIDWLVEDLSKESACDDFIDNIDVRFGVGSSCRLYFCSDCDYKHYCDKTCDYCAGSPSPFPTLDPTEDVIRVASSDTQDTDSYSGPCIDWLNDDLGKESACIDFIENIEQIYPSGTACSGLFCSDCQYAHYCDSQCNFCATDESISADSESDQSDEQGTTMDSSLDETSSENDDASSNEKQMLHSSEVATLPEPSGSGRPSLGTGQGIIDSINSQRVLCSNSLDTSMGKEGLCALYLSNGVECDAQFCDGCSFSGLCDQACGFCSSPSSSNPAESFAAIDLAYSPAVCKNQLDRNIGDGECEFYESSGYSCDDFFCPHCDGVGYCDEYCGFC